MRTYAGYYTNIYTFQEIKKKKNGYRLKQRRERERERNKRLPPSLTRKFKKKKKNEK